jgi:hypothetical protein
VVVVAMIVAADVVYIHAFGVNVPYHDEWNLLPSVQDAYAGRAGLDLWTQYVDYRLVVSRVLLVVLAYTTRLNVKVEMYVAVLSLVAALAIIWRLARPHPRSSLWPMIPIAALLFSWCQFQNILFGLQLTWFLVTIGVVATVWALQQRSRRRFVLAIGLAVFTSLCTGQGLTVWAIGLVALLAPAVSWKARIIWLGLGAAVVGIYFWGFNVALAETGGPPLISVFQQPGEALAYFLLVAGSPLTLLQLGGTPQVATIIGGAVIVVIGAMVVLYWARYGRANPAAQLAAALILFATLSDGLATVARAAEGLNEGFASRYTTSTLMLLVGTYIFVWRVVIPSLSRSTIGHAAITSTVTLLVITQLSLAAPFGLTAGVANRTAGERAVQLLLHYDTAPLSELHRGLFGRYDDFRDEAAWLKAQKLSVWSAGY